MISSYCQFLVIIFTPLVLIFTSSSHLCPQFSYSLLVLISTPYSHIYSLFSYSPHVLIFTYSSYESAHSIRHRVREHRGDETKAKKVLRERMEMALFGVSNIPHHITDKVLARDGGINAFRNYVPEIVQEVKESIPEFRLDQFFGTNSPMGHSKVATVAGGVPIRRGSTSSNLSHAAAGITTR